MQLSKAHLHAAAFVVGGAALGALATAASGVGADPASATAAEAAVAAPSGPVAPIEPRGAAGAAGAAGDAETAAHAAPERATRLASNPAAESIDPRFLVAPLSERFTQWSQGAANPGLRQAPHRDSLSEMVAAVFPTEESVRTVVLAPRVNPPPPPDGDDDEDGEDGEGDNEGPCGDEVCPPDGGGGGDGGGGEGGSGAGGGGGGGGEPPAGVPEIDGGLLGSGILLLVGGALVLASRRSV